VCSGMSDNNHRLNQPFVNNLLQCDNSAYLLTQFTALLIINQSQQKKGQFNPTILDEAQKIFNSMEADSPMQIEALRDLVTAFSKAGRCDEAENLSQQLNNNSVVKAHELQELATVLITKGDIFALDAVSVFSKAEEFARAIKHRETKVKALRELAAVLLQTRYIHKALALIEECDMLSNYNI
jgi:lipopolysaccharide biosynthesis regulator YciM